MMPLDAILRAMNSGDDCASIESLTTSDDERRVQKMEENQSESLVGAIDDVPTTSCKECDEQGIDEGRMVDIRNEDEDCSPAHDEEEDSTDSLLSPTSSTFRPTCRFVTRIGLAAYAYGSPSVRVEAFVQSMLLPYSGMFGITNTECFAVFNESEDSEQIITIRPLQPQQFNLYRLGRISDIAKNVLRGEITQSQALDELDAVEKEPDPFGKLALFLAYIVIGAGLVALFQGSWWDLVASLVVSGPVFVIAASVPPEFAKAGIFLSAGVSAALATVGQQYLYKDIHTGTIVLSSIAVLLPGYAATLAISELLSHHIVCGLDRLVHAILDLLLLFAGAWSGAAILGGSLGTFSNDGEDDSSSPYAWIGWITPVLLISLAIQFQTSLRDFPWVLLHLAFAFCTVFFLGYDDNHGNRLWAGVFCAALVTTALAQLWARFYDRPRSIVLVPCMVLLVSGSIGFRGLVTLASNAEDEGGVTEGLQQLLQMFLVTFLILGGVLVGSVCVPTKTTL